MILPPRYASRIHRISHLSFLSALLALYTQGWTSALVPFVVGCTTRAYWADPTPGWRRRVDIAAVVAGGAYQWYHAPPWYTWIVALTSLCYARARSATDPDEASQWHAALHVCANAGNVMLCLLS